MVHNFCYVTEKEAKIKKQELINLINEVQDKVRNNFTFSFQFIGSSSRNMITYDRNSNIGYDFDVNINVNDDEENYEPKEIKYILMNAFDKFVRKYGYDYCENSTSVFTIKVKDFFNSKIIHSCDFAVVYECEDGNQQYIRYNKKQNYYSWEQRGKGYSNLPEKIEWIKKHHLTEELKKYYLYKKNNNQNPDKRSRALYAESINDICMQNGYYKTK